MKCLMEPRKYQRIKRIFYRVFNKEGHKVLGCKTYKKCDFEAIKELKASENMGHFDNQSSFFKRWT